MSKILWAIVIAGVLLFGVYEGWLLWDNYRTNKDLEEKQSAVEVVPERLMGMPQGWEESYKKAESNGPAATKNWLKAYGLRVEDPRRAWIELDYMVSISKEDPSEAKRIFADVKGRTPTNSPVYPRIKKLERTYE